MSRIGKMPITIPEGVMVQINEKHVVVKGPKGQLEWDIPQEINVKIEDNTIYVTRNTDKRQHKMLHGTTRAVLNNMIVGVVDGYIKELELHGVGYKVEKEGNKLKFALGLNNPIYVEIPDNIEVEVVSQTELKISGIDKTVVGNFAGVIRNLRKPDAYKGKGVRYKGEQIKLKEVKTLAA